MGSMAEARVRFLTAVKAHFTARYHKGWLSSMGLRVLKVGSVVFLGRENEQRYDYHTLFSCQEGSVGRGYGYRKQAHIAHDSWSESRPSLFFSNDNYNIYQTVWCTFLLHSRLSSPSCFCFDCDMLWGLTFLISLPSLSQESMDAQLDYDEQEMDQWSHLSDSFKLPTQLASLRKIPVVGT